MSNDIPPQSNSNFGPAEKTFKALFEQTASELFSLTNNTSQPNIHAAMMMLREVNMLALNIKFFGYDLARQLATTLPVRTNLEPHHVGLGWKPSTQADLESDWAAYWCSQLKIPLIFHRKLWEFAYVLQAVYEHGLICPGSKGLGFGCGTEPLPSYLASQGVAVTVTDLDPSLSQDKGWTNTNQHTSSLEHAFHPHLVSRELFDSHVDLKYVDMNAIPADLTGYDFCWSVCALEHLGSIKHGLDFIENSLATLRPGGTAIHTTEFNFLNDHKTIDNWQTVLFQKRHFSELADRLRAKGHHVSGVDFNVGNKPLDRFIDVPPWTWDISQYAHEMWGHDSAHIKLSIDGFASTCFGVIVKKAD